jgi:hypothetical protein
MHKHHLVCLQDLALRLPGVTLCQCREPCETACDRDLAAELLLRRAVHLHLAATEALRWVDTRHEQTAMGTVHAVLLNKCSAVLPSTIMILENSAISCFTTTYLKAKFRKLQMEGTIWPRADRTWR